MRTKSRVSSEQHEQGRFGAQLSDDEKTASAREGQREDSRRLLQWNTIDEAHLARGLGWFSIGLGLAELTAPRAIEKLVGVSADHRRLIRVLGLREIASGIGILMQAKPVESVWSRVGGDAIDLTFLSAAFTSPHARRGRVAIATAAVVGVTVLDVVCAQQLSRNWKNRRGVIHHKKSVTVNRSAEDLYRFWRDFENFPHFMDHLQSVQVTGEGRSHWVANAPAGGTVEWAAEITDDRPNERIAWRSLEGADVNHEGSVRFERAPGGRGTIVKVDMQYSPPGGALGATIAKFFGEEPGQQVYDDLRRFKQVMETGEVVLSEGSLHGTGAMQQRPGQPPSGR